MFGTAKLGESARTSAPSVAAATKIPLAFAEPCKTCQQTCRVCKSDCLQSTAGRNVQRFCRFEVDLIAAKS